MSFNDPEIKQLKKWGIAKFIDHHTNNAIVIIEMNKIILKSEPDSDTMEVSIDAIKQEAQRIIKAMEVLENRYKIN